MPLPFHTYDSDNREGLTVSVPKETYLFFQKLVLPRGAMQSIGCEFYVKLQAALVAEGISGFDIDNVERISAVLSRLSFNPNKEKPLKGKNKQKDVPHE